MTRKEHLAWAKQRALEFVDAGDLQQAFTSFTSDLGKHPELAEALELLTQLGMSLFLMGNLSTAQEMRKHIEGYN